MELASLNADGVYIIERLEFCDGNCGLCIISWLMCILEVQKVEKSYKTAAGFTPALAGVSFAVKQGEFVAIYGKSGAGKSTLINIISGIDCPDSGHIVFNGVSINRLSEDERSRWRGKNLGVVFQFFQLLPTLNLIENITIAMDLSDALPLSEHRGRALQLLEQVGIADHALKPPSKISGGQQQRVAIARALANDPPMIAADEPTGNLDSKTRDGIMEIFSSLAKSGKTILVVTHDKEIASWADRVVYLKDGRITEFQE